MSSPQQNEPLQKAGEDDSGEYTLLPPDAEVLEGERRRREKQIAEWDAKAAEQPLWEDEYRDWDVDFKFRVRFGVKDMLAAMAIVALALTCLQWIGFCAGFSLFVLSTLVWIQYRMTREERARLEERNKATGRAAPARQKQNWRELARACCSYSVADMLIAMTVAACVFALLGQLGSAFTLMVLGTLVTAGIVAYWLDFRPSRRWWLVWWVICFSYVMFAIVTAIRLKFFP